MKDWIAHQFAVWCYGAGLLFVLALFAIGWSLAGALLWYAISSALGLPFYGWGWFLCSAALAPFNLPSIAQSLGEIVRRDPPPSEVDLFRKQLAREKRG